MMVDGFFVVWLQGYLKHTKTLAFEENFVVFWVCDHGVQCLVIVPDREGNSGIRTALVDGFIFGRVEHLAELESAQLRRLPFAVVDFDPGPSISSVRVDARSGCYAAAKHLIEHGHRCFGIVSFLRSSGSARVHPPGQRRSPEAAWRTH